MVNLTNYISEYSHHQNHCCDNSLDIMFLCLFGRLFGRGMIAVLFLL